MRVFIFLAAAAVLVITVTEGIPLVDKEDLFSENEDNRSFQEDKEILTTEDENKNENAKDDETQVLIESRHHRRDRPWKGQRPPPGQFPPGFYPPPVYSPSYYPYPPLYYPPPYYPPFAPTRTEGPIPSTSTELTSPAISITSPPPMIALDDGNVSLPMNMTVTVGGQNLTLSQVTCLLDFFLHPSADTKLEHCINDDGTEIAQNNNIVDDNEEDYTEGTGNPSTENSTEGTENPSTENSTEGTENPSTENSTEGTTGNPSTENSTEGTENPSTKNSTEGTTGNPSTENSTEGTTGNPSTENSTEDDQTTLVAVPNIIMQSETTPAASVDTLVHGIYIPGILPPFVGDPGRQLDPSQFVNNLFGGINNLLGTIVSGVKQPNYHQYQTYYDR